jgi:hypothetical protein
MVRTGHPSDLLSYLPLKGWKGPETLRSPGGRRRTAMPHELDIQNLLSNRRLRPPCTIKTTLGLRQVRRGQVPHRSLLPKWTRVPIRYRNVRRGRSFTATLDATVINSLACHIVERLWMELAVSPQASETASIPPASTTA